MDKNIILIKTDWIQIKTQPNHSLSDITELIRDISNLNVSFILLDLQKAFDTINHEYRPYELEAYRVRGVNLDWFTSYLSERNQCVIINSKIWKPLTNNCGVPDLFRDHCSFFSV